MERPKNTRIETKAIMVKAIGKTNVIPCDHILYCQASGPYARIILQKGNALIITKPLKWLHGEANVPYLIRISQSALVNIRHIQRIHHRDKQVEMTNGDLIRFTTTIKELENRIQGGRDE